MSIFGEHNATRTSSLRERSVNEADLSRLSRALEPKKNSAIIKVAHAAESYSGSEHS